MDPHFQPKFSYTVGMGVFPDIPPVPPQYPNQTLSPSPAVYAPLSLRTPAAQQQQSHGVPRYPSCPDLALSSTEHDAPAPVAAPAVPDPMEELRKEREAFLREEQERQRKHQEMRELKRKERMRKAEKEQEELKGELDAIVEETRKRADEEERRMEMEKAERQKKWQKRQELADTQFEQEMSLRSARFTEEQEQFDAQRTLVNEQTEAVLREQNEQMKRAEEEHMATMRRIDEERLREQAEHEARVQKIREEYEMKKAAFERRAEQRARQMRRQLEQLSKMLQFRIWNEIVERNWSNRLAALRAANRQVATRFHTFLCATSSSQKEVVQIRLEALLDALSAEEKLMEAETENLQTLLDNTGKRFLERIIIAVVTIVTACRELRNSLSTFSQSLEHIFQLDPLPGLQEQERTLARCVQSVPTLAELKRAHREEMSSRTSQPEDVPFQSVIIEEIDEEEP